MVADAPQLHDLSGRPLGRRALLKRQRILATTRALLEDVGLRDLRVADIARAVGTSTATFYQYFADVEDVVLQLAADANREIPQLLAMFEGNWRGSAGLQRATEIVEFFMAYWDRHGPILRIRNLAADEGDQRFMELRGRAMMPVLKAMENLMERCGATQKKADIRPAAAALAMSAILDRLAAYHQVMESESLTHDELVRTSAEILYRTLTGK